MERVATGIPGLDELLKGGFPRASSILISGGVGTGKSILSMQYLIEGAKQSKESGLYVTIESSQKNIMWDMASFNWDIKRLQDSKYLSIYRMKIGYNRGIKLVEERIDEELEMIKAKVQEINAERLVIDSTTSFGMWFESAVLRAMLFRFVDFLGDLNCTTVLTSETPEVKGRFSAFGVEEFVTDGVIALFFTPPHRSLFIRKMRGTSHDKNVHPFEITEKGIIVKSKEIVAWEAIK